MTTKTEPVEVGNRITVQRQCGYTDFINSSHKPKECKRRVVQECCGTDWCAKCLFKHKSKEHPALN